MACPDYVISSSGRAGIGVNQDAGLDYPLVRPSSDIDYLLADFYLAFEPPAFEITYPLSIRYLYGVGCVENTPAVDFFTPTHAADIVVVDAANRVVFNSAVNTAFTVSAWGTDYKIYEWLGSAAVCRLVTHTTWAPDTAEQQQYDKYLTPTSAKLAGRATYQMPRRLRTISVRNGQSEHGPYAGNILLKNSYNTELAGQVSSNSPFRNNTAITVSAQAGSGAGLAPCSSTGDVPITSINGVSPSASGDFLISATDCLFARRPLVDGAVDPDNQLHIGTGCTAPCCKCSDYSDLAKYLNLTRDRYALIGQRAENVRTAHENNIARWNAQRGCSTANPLRLMLTPQMCPYMDIVMMACNPCTTCLPPVTLSVMLTVSSPGVTASLVCGNTALFGPNVNGKPVAVYPSPDGLTYSSTLPQIPPGDSAYLKFRVKFLAADGSKPAGPVIVTGVLTGALSDQSLMRNNCGSQDARESYSSLSVFPATGKANTLYTDLSNGFVYQWVNEYLRIIIEPAVATVAQALYCSETGTTEAPC